MIGETQPDIVVIDEMQNGDQAPKRIRECREAAPSATVLLLTMRMDDSWVAKGLSAGAVACLSKSVHPSIGTLIREVANRNVISAPPPAASDDGLSSPGNEGLTAPEREILRLAAHGLTNARIGKQLWVTEQTVKFQLSNIYRKLGVSNLTEASCYAHAHGLMGRPGPQLVPTPTAPDSLAPAHSLRAGLKVGAA